MESFLIAVDHSPYLDKILAYCGRVLKDIPGAKLVFLNIRQSCLMFADMITEVNDKDIIFQKIEEMKHNKKKCLEGQKKMEDTLRSKIHAMFPESDRVVIDVSEENGEYAQMILSKAKEYGCSTIVLGKKGESIVSEYLIGSVTEKVCRLARGYTVWLVE